MVIGCPGSGKSTFSKRLHKITGIPIFHLDMINWNPDRTCVEKEVFIQRLIDIIQEDEWIIDGNYGSTLDLRMEYCDTIIFLDYTLEICLKGIEDRKGKERSDIPWVEPVDNIDYQFIDFIKNFKFQSRPMIMELLEKYKDKEIHIFKDRIQADYFLDKYDF